MPLSLDLTHDQLGWPSREDILRPSGGGARVFANLADIKIGRALLQFKDAADAKVGVLLANPHAAATEPPLGVIVDFPRHVADDTLRELHRLAWNFSHCPTLITLEPQLLRVWTCCEPPDATRELDEFVVEKMSEAGVADIATLPIASRALSALHWVNLVSGQFFRDHAVRFDRSQRADQMLLRNLQHIRRQLREAGIQDDDVCHDLLARVVFVQFLFDRKDSDGNAALTSVRLARLRELGILRRPHTNFAGILGDYQDTYRLFDWLNSKFNGDLFPGKGDTARARALGWTKEKNLVTQSHLSLLADFIRGDLEMPSGQQCLWPHYSFDVIPLEFISTIYEAFVDEKAAREGIYYTPPHLVDFILDRVLPWDGEEWDLKILDPACGSGVFLVKAFQRLIHRWKHANTQPPRADVLRRMLERNIFGVDKDPHAVRVACFSLYLAMCDEIDPKHYWSQVLFPEMRGHRLINADFFDDDQEGFQTNNNKASYDLVIGNAPWGEELLTPAAQKWATSESHRWPLPNKGISTLFLIKAAHLTKPTGRIAMIQSAGSLLFNRSKPALEFRKLFFTTHRVEEIVNLSALRFKIFTAKAHASRTSVAPACIVVLHPEPPGSDHRISYASPKQLDQLVDEFSIIIEPQDRRFISVVEAATIPWIWPLLMWGNNRDKAFLARLRSCRSLAKPGLDFEIKSREGIIFGDRQKLQRELRGRRILKEKSFPQGPLLYLDVDDLPENRESYSHSRDSTDFEAFSYPQLIVKQAWVKHISRFQAKITLSAQNQGALCSQSYVTVHTSSAGKDILEAACLSLNSMFATYFLLLTSSRFASYRPEPLVEELLAVPIPHPRVGILKGVTTWDEIDLRISDEFGFKEPERALIEDLFKITLPDFIGGENSVGYRPTQRNLGRLQEPELTSYCEYFIRVLKAGFGQDRPVVATIFQEKSGQLPYRLVAFELGRAAAGEVFVEHLDSPGLVAEFERLSHLWQRQHRSGSNIYQQRVARIYDSGGGNPAIFVLKPDMHRYWTRSMGLYDADEATADFLRWQWSTGTKFPSHA